MQEITMESIRKKMKELNLHGYRNEDIFEILDVLDKVAKRAKFDEYHG